MKKLFCVFITSLLLISLVLTSCNKKEETPDFGTLTIADITLNGGDTRDISPVFSKDSYDISYTFDGEDIKIENGIGIVKL